MNGFLNILKPAGMSSAAVVAVIRRLTGEKRVGHAGTLDPDAAGVLPIMTGKATRLFDYLADKEKEYIAVAAFGAATDTQDATGEVTETGDHYPDRALIETQIRTMIGDIIQVPSMYSAIKVGGKPLYLRARLGETVRVPERVVHIEQIDVLRDMPDHGIELRVRCGRGTYIRTLCHDLGRKCGCPAHMRSLLRSRSGPFTLENAVSLDEARNLAEEGKLREKLLPPDFALTGLPRADVPEKWRKKVENGARIPGGGWSPNSLPENAPVRVYMKDEFWGIAVFQNQELVWKALIAPGKEEENGVCG